MQNISSNKKKEKSWSNDIESSQSNDDEDAMSVFCVNIWWIKSVKVSIHLYNLTLLAKEGKHGKMMNVELWSPVDIFISSEEREKSLMKIMSKVTFSSS